MSVAYNAWDVIAVPFPYSDRDSAKRRPALIVSADALHEEQGIYWVAMITTAKNTRYPGDIPIRSIDKTGLHTPSVIRPAKLATIEHDAIIRRIGAAGVSERNAVRKFIISHLA
jgi:mRNA interferase MazF